MKKNFDFNPPPDPTGQIHSQLSNSDAFLLALAALKSTYPPEWNTLAGLRYLAGFIGTPYSTARRIAKKGTIPSYKIGGIYHFLISEVIKGINEDPALSHFNWLSYEDREHSENEHIIHFKKFRYADHVLIKYTFERQTYYTVLPPEMWRRNSKIGNALIHQINQNLKNTKR